MQDFTESCPKRLLAFGRPKPWFLPIPRIQDRGLDSLLLIWLSSHIPQIDLNLKLAMILAPVVKCALALFGVVPFGAGRLRRFQGEPHAE